MISSLASKWQVLTVGMPVFQPLYEVKLKASKFKVLAFWSQIMTKFKSQALHIIKIKYWKASGSGNPPSLIPALQKSAILGLKTKFSILFCTRLYYWLSLPHSGLALDLPAWARVQPLVLLSECGVLKFNFQHSNFQELRTESIYSLVYIIPLALALQHTPEY